MKPCKLLKIKNARPTVSVLRLTKLASERKGKATSSPLQTTICGAFQALTGHRGARLRMVLSRVGLSAGLPVSAATQSLSGRVEENMTAIAGRNEASLRGSLPCSLAKMPFASTRRSNMVLGSEA